MSIIHGCSCIELTQQRYSDGKVYISVILDGEEIKSLDVRYFIEIGNELIPTKYGYRVKQHDFTNLYNTLKMKPCEINENILSESRKGSRFLIAH